MKIINYYCIPGELRGHVYVEDLTCYERIIDEKPMRDDVLKRVEELKKMYPDAPVCEFMY